METKTTHKGIQVMREGLNSAEDRITARWTVGGRVLGCSARFLKRDAGGMARATEFAIGYIDEMTEKTKKQKNKYLDNMTIQKPLRLTITLGIATSIFCIVYGIIRERNHILIQGISLIPTIVLCYYVHSINKNHE